MAHSEAFYHSVAAIQGKAAISGDATGRAVMPMGKAWTRCNPGVELIWVDDAEGRPRALTPKQYQVLVAALEMIDGVGITMRELAKRLGVAPSTISRALTKLQAWGLIGVLCGRGRFAGLVIFRTVKGDGWEYLRKAARARVQRWKLAAEARISRLWINVAPYIYEEGRESTRSHYYLTTNKGATLTTQPFTPEEIRQALGEM